MACMLSDRNFKRWRQAVEAYPLEVFVVTSGSYSDYRIVSIHPTLREAMDTCPEVGSWELEEDKGQVWNSKTEQDEFFNRKAWVPETEKKVIQRPGLPTWTRKIPLYNSDSQIEVYPLSCPFPEWLENRPRMIDQRDDPSDPNGSPGRSHDDPPSESSA
jgi:hypothetical protein